MTKLSNKFARAAKRGLSLLSATAIAVTGLVTVATPSNATAAPIVKSFDYQVRVATPSTPVVIPASIYSRLDFQVDFADDDVTDLRSHVITVGTQDTGFTLQNGSSPVITYAYFRFYDENNATIDDGQINNGHSGEPLNDMNSFTVPALASKMTIDWTAAINLGYGSDDPLAAGTYSSTPKIYDNGTASSPSAASALSYVADSASTAGLYYETAVSDNAGPLVNVQGVGQSFNLPASGTISGVSSKAAGCIDPAKISASTIATPSIKLNGTTPDTTSFRISDSTLTNGGMNDVANTSFDFSAGRLQTWLNAGTPLYAYATAGGMYGMYDTSITTNGLAVDETFDVVDQNNVSILKSCVPVAPTGTGTLGAGVMQGSVSFTPTTYVPPAGDWACNLYKASDNSFVSSGSGYGVSGACMFATIGPNGPVIPSGVAVYAKVMSKVKILNQTFSTAGAEKSNNYTVTGGGGGGNTCPPTCGPPPVVVPAGFIPPKVTWAATAVLKVGTKMTAVKSNLPGTRTFNWVRCPSAAVRAAGTVTNGNVFPGTGTGCEVLSAAGTWTPSAQMGQQFSPFTGVNYTVKSTDTGKNFSIIDFSRCSGQCSFSSPAVSKTVKVNDKVEPNYPATKATLKKNAKLNIANKNNQALSVVVTSTTTPKCTVAKVGANYVVTGKALGVCLVKIAVTGNTKIATANEVHAITIN